MPLEIIIKARTNGERNTIGKEIHNLLKGNPDYADNAIVLNVDRDKRVRIWIFDESTTKMKVVPERDDTNESR